MDVVRPRQGSAPVEVVFPFRRGVGDHVGRTQPLPSVGLGDAFHMPALSDKRAVGWKGVNPVQHRDGKQVDRVILLVRLLQLALQFRGEGGHLPACVVITGLRQIFEYGGAAAFPQAKKGCRGDVLGSGLQRPPCSEIKFLTKTELAQIYVPALAGTAGQSLVLTCLRLAAFAPVQNRIVQASRNGRLNKDDIRREMAVISGTAYEDLLASWRSLQTTAVCRTGRRVSYAGAV